jgi:hypothetical protein
MKPFWKTLCLLGAVMLHNSHDLMAQCTNTLQSVTYDTLVAGTGNDTHVFSLPQMDPSAGTLVYAKINSRVSVNYGFTLQNVENVPRTFSVSVGRYDHFSSATLSTPFTDINTVPLGSYPLNPGNSVSRVPAPIMSQYLKSDSVTQNMAGFLGSGQVDFAYTPITYTNLTGSNTYYYSATASDTIRFSITYYYCNTSILASGLTDFSATRENAGTVQLLWQTVNEQTGNSYQVEESADGNLFHEVATENAEVGADQTGHYQYQYGLEGSDHGNIYFRLRETSRQGTVHYSEIRMVELGEGTAATLSVYPNPSSQFINLLFGGHRSNWQVEIYAAHGALVQRNYVAGASRAFIPFKQKLAAGVYFIRALDEQTRQNQVTTFVVE